MNTITLQNDHVLPTEPKIIELWLKHNHCFSHHGCLSSPKTESKPRFTSSSPAIAPSPATISASVATTATALAPAMLSVGSSFGVQAAAPPGSSLCASGPSGYTSVGGSSNVGGTFTVGGTSISNVGGATTSSSSQGKKNIAFSPDARR